MTTMRSIVLALLAVSLVACNKTPAEGTAGADGTIKVVASEKGFAPSSVKVKKGVPTTLSFLRTTDQTCATEVVFPDLNVKKDLPKGQPVTIPIPTDKEQTLTFQCGMGMYKSSVVIASN